MSQILDSLVIRLGLDVGKFRTDLKAGLGDLTKLGAETQSVIDELGKSYRQEVLQLQALTTEEGRALAIDRERLGIQRQRAQESIRLAARQAENDRSPLTRILQDRVAPAAQALGIGGPALGLLTGAATFAGVAFAATGAAKAIGSAISSAALFEQAMIGVRKTTGLAGDEFDQLSAGVLDLSAKLGIPAIELANITATAGQLGINGKAALLAFTETAAKLGAVSELTSDQAAQALAQIGNAFGLLPADAAKLGSVLNELSNTTSATAGDIAGVLQRVGVAGRSIGLTVDQVAALGATLRAAGLPAETAGVSLRNFLTIAQTKSAELAKVVGVTQAQFDTMLSKDAFGALRSYLTALGKLPPQLQAIRVEKTFGQENVLTVQTLAQQTDQLNANLEISARSFREGASLNREYATSMDGLIAQWTLLKARVAAFVTDGAGGAVPALTSLLKALNGASNGAEALAGAVQQAREQMSRTEAAEKLLNRYDALTANTRRTKEQTDELKRVTAQIAEQFPAYVTQVDAAGTAMGIYSGALRTNIELQRQAAQFDQRDPIEKMVSGYRDASKEVGALTSRQAALAAQQQKLRQRAAAGEVLLNPIGTPQSIREADRIEVPTIEGEQKKKTDQIESLGRDLAKSRENVKGFAAQLASLFDPDKAPDIETLRSLYGVTDAEIADIRTRRDALLATPPPAAHVETPDELAARLKSEADARADAAKKGAVEQRAIAEADAGAERARQEGIKAELDAQLAALDKTDEHRRALIAAGLDAELRAIATRDAAERRGLVGLSPGLAAAKGRNLDADRATAEGKARRDAARDTAALDTAQEAEKTARAKRIGAAELAVIEATRRAQIDGIDAELSLAETTEPRRRELLEQRYTLEVAQITSKYDLEATLLRQQITDETELRARLAQTEAERQQELGRAKRTQITATDRLEQEHDKARREAVKRYTSDVAQIIGQEAARALRSQRRYTDTDVRLQQAGFKDREKALRQSLSRQEITTERFNLEMSKLTEERASFDKDVEADRAGFVHRTVTALTDALIQEGIRLLAAQAAKAIEQLLIGGATAAAAAVEVSGTMATIGAAAAGPAALVSTASFGAAGAAGAAGIAAALAAAKVAQIGAFAKGGLIPGTPSATDNTLIMARTGETVLTPEMVARLGGPAVMRAIGVPGYATGGVVGRVPSANDFSVPRFTATEAGALRPDRDLIGAVGELRAEVGRLRSDTVAGSNKVAQAAGRSKPVLLRRELRQAQVEIARSDARRTIGGL